MTHEELIEIKRRKKRALRRAILQRRKAWAKSLGRRVQDADHMACPCWMCGNQRWITGPSWKEIRFACEPLFG